MKTGNEVGTSERCHLYCVVCRWLMVGGLTSELVGYAWMIALVGQATRGELSLAELMLGCCLYVHVYRYSMDILEVCGWSFLLNIWFALCIGDWYFTLLKVVARCYARLVENNYCVVSVGHQESCRSDKYYFIYTAVIQALPKFKHHSGPGHINSFIM